MRTLPGTRSRTPPRGITGSIGGNLLREHEPDRSSLPSEPDRLWDSLSTYSEIPDEQRRRFQAYCADFERTSGKSAIVEPRDTVKGDIVRSILYMLDSYGLRCQPTCSAKCY